MSQPLLLSVTMPVSASGDDSSGVLQSTSESHCVTQRRTPFSFATHAYKQGESNKMRCGCAVGEYRPPSFITSSYGRLFKSSWKKKRVGEEGRSGPMLMANSPCHGEQKLIGMRELQCNLLCPWALRRLSVQPSSLFKLGKAEGREEWESAWRILTKKNEMRRSLHSSQRTVMHTVHASDTYTCSHQPLEASVYWTSTI